MANSQRKKRLPIPVAIVAVVLLFVFQYFGFDVSTLLSDGKPNSTQSTYVYEVAPTSPFEVINNNVPNFTKEEITSHSFESYAPLDALGRCGTAFASVGRDIMPTQKRGSISEVKPTGWHSVRYENVDGESLYNRCHLLGFQLTGENANHKNLVTGTRYLNVEGMLPFENLVADFVKETNMHVMYRVTPLFQGNDLVPYGVTMEGLSVEDGGEGVQFHVLCYNVQPDIGIDYATGKSWKLNK